MKIATKFLAIDLFLLLSKCINTLNKQSLDNQTAVSGIKYCCLRWSETKKLKTSIPDNIFFLYLIIVKLCTFKQLENIHQKLKLIFS